MPVKLLFAQLYHLRQRKQHLNNCLLLLSTFLPHNLNLHQLPRKSQQLDVAPFGNHVCQ